MANAKIKQKLASLEGVAYKLMKAALSMTAGYIVSKATLFSILSPFSVSLIAVSPFSELYAIAVYAGSVAGFLTKSFSVFNFKYVCADTVMLIIVLIAGRRNYKKNIYTSALPAAVCLSCGVVFLFAERIEIYNILLVVCETVLCGCFAYFLNYFITAYKRKTRMTSRDLIAFNITLLVAECAFDSMYVCGFSLSLIFTTLVVYLSTYYIKSGTATVFTLTVCSVYALLHSANDKFIIMLYIPALVSIAVSKFKKSYTEISFIIPYLTLCATVGQVSILDYQLYSAPIISAMLFRLVPKDRLSVFLSKYIEVSREATGKDTAATCDELCEKFRQNTAELVKEISFTHFEPIINEETEGKLKRILISSGCRNVNTANYTSVEGRQTAALYFKAEKEPDLAEIVKRAGKLTGKKLKIVGKSVDGANYSVKLEALHSYTVTCHALYKSKRGETVCGDSVTAFKASNERYNMLIADGMGSGETAYNKSSSVITLFKKLLAGGASAVSAIGSANAALEMLRDEVGFSTVDLCTISLDSGVAEFYKCGAYSSFIIRGNSLITVKAGGFPVGLDSESEHSYFSTSLRDGDLIVMMSDGVSPAIDQIQAHMLMSSSRDPAVITRELIDCAYNAIPPEYDDDMTVLTAVIKQNTVE